MSSLIERLLIAISSVLVVLMIILMNAEVIGRYLFGVSTRISEEYSSYMFCAATMLAFYPALMQGRFLRVSGVLSLLPLKIRAAWELFIAAISAAFCFIVLEQTWGLFSMSRDFGSRSEQYSATPLMYPQLVLLVGMAILCLGMLYRGYVLFQHLWRGETDIVESETNVAD